MTRFQASAPWRCRLQGAQRSPSGRPTRSRGSPAAGGLLRSPSTSGTSRCLWISLKLANTRQPAPVSDCVARRSGLVSSNRRGPPTRHPHPFAEAPAPIAVPHPVRTGSHRPSRGRKTAPGAHALGPERDEPSTSRSKKASSAKRRHSRPSGASDGVGSRSCWRY
jgi:hypothetical protein